MLGAGASCGIAVWELVFGDLMRVYVRSNQIEPATRKLLALFGGVGIALPLIAVAIYWWTHRTRPLGAARRIELLGWKLSPLCLAIAVPMLFRWQIWKGLDIQFLVMGLAAHGITGVVCPGVFISGWHTRHRTQNSKRQTKGRCPTGRKESFSKLWELVK